MIDEILEMLEYEGGTVIKYGLVIIAVLCGLFWAYGNYVAPLAATPTPLPATITPFPTTAPAIAPTATPLPPNTFYYIMTGEYGAHRILVALLTPDVPAVYDPDIGLKDDALNAAYGLAGNRYIIPAFTPAGQTFKGYYSVADGAFHYFSAGNVTEITIATPTTDARIAAALRNNTYALVDFKTINGVNYGIDCFGNLVTLDGTYTPVIIDKLQLTPAFVKDLNIQWKEQEQLNRPSITNATA